MCDQTEVIYNTGDVVWVKLGPVWWPGQVQDYEALPEEITSNLRKKPIAVVKFFQEETFEYVKNLNHIYHYNCRKKEEFIKKGLDLVRSSNSRDVPSNMKMFPEDIVMAEHVTGGDPNILNNEMFAPEQKSDYSDLFGAKKTPAKRGKSDSKKDCESWKPRRNSLPFKNGRHSLPVLPSNIPRPITHPRFLTKALEGKSDHEVRIRCQISNRRDYEENPTVEKVYNCHLCEFHTSRLNVIILHNKSHSASFIEAQNAIRAKLKSRERDIFPSTPFNDQTPKMVTSRGRVKSVPKKLMDYSDEPPAKIFKEKVYSKSVNKEEKIEPPIKSTSPKSPNKTPKKEKDIEKTSIKRPLFGKRKTAKEKAELAAKQKQANEAMKETLLKDWDDDDVMQGEVELEQLKQALESTTCIVEFEDSNVSGTESPIGTQSPEHNVTKDKGKPLDSKVSDTDINREIKAKVFEFDDSEDSLPVTNFRLKNQREKFTDDKFKKPKPPKPLTKIVPKSKSPKMSLSPSSKQEGDKETEEFNLAFNSLLEETAVPVLPEIPKTSLSFSVPVGEISEQTSDISSSTDLVKDFNIVEEADIKVNEKETQHNKLDSELISTEMQSECTSSDSEEQVSEPLIHIQNVEKTPLREDQKNLNEVSASDPSVEMDCDLSLSGVATTTADNFKSLDPLLSVNETSILKEDSSITEISSTCDIAKSYTEEPKSINEDELTIAMEEYQTEKDNGTLKTKNQITDDLEKTCFQVDNSSMEEDNAITEKSKIGSIMQGTEPESLETASTCSDTTKIEQTYKEPTDENILDESIIEETKPDNDNENVTKHESLPKCIISDQDTLETTQFEISQTNDTTLDQSDLNLDNNKIDQCKEEFVLPSNDSNEKLEEEIVKQTENSIATEECISTQSNLIPTTTQSMSIENLVDVQMIMPVNTVSKSNTVNNSKPIASSNNKEERTEIGSVEIKKQSQNLQDMELDINSMPVIIGGEDFIQTEEPKQNLVAIEPSYSESIVISPKVTPSPKKSESVIVHLGEPSTSNKQIQPVISIPSKSLKSGARAGRSQKGTSKTIKLSASALKNLGALQKGGNQQVLILKTASSGQDKSDKATLQKHKGQLNMFQHGDKILIVNNAQMSGQNKIKLNPQQQQLLTGGKLAPGTRVITSKVVATTSSQSSESPSKMSISKSPSKPTQKLVISKGGLLSGSSKSVIINSSKLISSVPGAHTLTTSKGQTLITHNIINTKSGLILPSSSQGTVTSGKTAAIITSQALSPNKGMILAPITSKGGTIISGNQKLRIVSSKAPLSGTRLVVQNSPGGKLKVDPQNKGQQVKLISGLRGQSSGNTILIQTSQGLVAKSISSSTSTTAGIQSTIRAKPMVRTVMTTIPTQAKIRPTSVQQPTAIQQTSSVKKVTTQKIKQSPNILQKTTRKSTPRAPKSSGNRLISPAVSLSEPLILSPATGLTGVNQPTLIQGQLPQSSDGLLYLTVDETGNCRQLDNKSMISFEGNSEAPRTIFIPANAQTQDVSNIYFAIDDAGNIVNITQPPTSTTLTSENVAPGQDILAKALANTQVLQQETIIPDIDVTSALASSSIDSSIVSSKSFSEHAHYPAPSLSHSVLETSLTLNQPIMSPLEVPSAVPPNIGQLSTLSSNFLSSNLIATKQKHIHPSMPLLTEESLANQTGSEPVFLLDSSNNIIPATSGSQISFQLTLDENNVIMTSGTDNAVIPSSYQVVSGNLLATQITDPEDTKTAQKLDSVKAESLETPSENITYRILSQDDQVQSEIAQTVKQGIILREALECSESNIKNDQFLNSVKEMPQNDSLENFNQSQDNIKEHGNEENPNLIECNSEQLSVSYDNQDIALSQEPNDANHSFKRSFGEEQTVTSSSDLESETKRVKIDER